MLALLVVLIVAVSGFSIPALVISLVVWINWLSTLVLLLRIDGNEGNHLALIAASLGIYIPVQALLYSVFLSLGTPYVSWVVLPLILVGLLTLNRRPPREATSLSRDDRGLLGAAIAVTVGVGVVLRLRFPATTPWDLAGLASDVPLFGNMINSLSTYGPGSSGFLTNWPYGYHWGSYGFLAALQPLGPDLTLPLLLYVLPALAAGGTLLAVGAISRVPWLPAWSQYAGPLGLLLAGSVGIWRFTEFSVWEWASPSTLVGGLMVASFTALFIRALQPQWLKGGAVPLVLLAGLAVFIKVSAAFVIIGALGLYLIYAIVNARFLARRVASLFLLSFGLFAITYLLLISGTDGNLNLAAIFTGSSDDGLPLTSIYLIDFARIAAILPAWAGLLIGLLNPPLRGKSFMWIAAIALAGLSGYVAFDAPAQNDKFFFIAASVVVTPVSVLLAMWLVRQLSLISRLRGGIAGLLFLAALGLLASAYYSSFFDVRPWLFPTLLLGASLVLAFLLFSADTQQAISRTRRMTSITAAVLVAFALAFPHVARWVPNPLPLADRSQLSNEERDQLAQRIQAFQNAAPSQADSGDANAAMQFIQPTPASFQTERWARYLSDRNGFSTEELDLKGLLKKGATAEMVDRNARISEILSADPSTQAARLCEEQIGSLWFVDAPPVPLSEPYFSILYSSDTLTVVRPTCASDESFNP